MGQRFKKFAEGAWRGVVPKSARNSLRLWLMTDLPDRAPRLIEDFAAGSVVVLAPHMDDEIIGPGGTVALHVRSGAGVTFVFISDGMAGDHGLTGRNLSSEEMAKQKRDYALARKQESRRAGEIVGVREFIFLDGPDGALADTPEIVAALAGILAHRRPAIVYAPAVTDHHRDHWATNRILRKALDQIPAEVGRDMLIRGYEIWTPAPANRMADITAVMEIKKKAIEAFASQTKLVDYSRSMTGLNQYRAMVNLSGKGYAEAFLETTADEYRSMFDRISLRNSGG